METGAVFPQGAEKWELWLSRDVAFAITSGVDPEAARNAAAAYHSPDCDPQEVDMEPMP
jgi:hypothetical protein